MNTGPAFATGRRAPNLLGVLLASLVSLLFVAGCGLSWGSGKHQTELFRKLTVTGDFFPNATLKLRLEYEQPYNVDVRARCALLKQHPDWTPTAKPKGATPTPTRVAIPRVHPTPSNTLYDILEETFPPNPNGGAADEVTPVPGVIERDFSVPEQPGGYSVRCYTPLDVNNSISTSFTIHPPPS